MSEGTAEYIRIIPWSSSAYACGSVGRPPVMKVLAAEGVMNRIAFEEMMAGPGLETQEAALTGYLKEGRQR